MTGTAEDVIVKYAGKGLLIDAHIVVLYVVGLTDRSMIEKFKRTQTYLSADFDTLVAIFSFFTRIVVTPHILAEASSLLGQLPERIRIDCFRSQFFNLIQILKEEYVPSQTGSSLPVFPKLGLTDATICAASSEYAVLTDDFALYGTLEKMGAAVINFTHLRTFD